MGIFKRSRVNYDDPTLDGPKWLASGEARYGTLISKHYGSPDTIANGGAQRAAEHDWAAALFFYQKAIDTLHSIYVCGFNDNGPSGWSRTPSPIDVKIVDGYLKVLAVALEIRPDAPIGESATEVTHRLGAIAYQFERYGLPAQPVWERLSVLGTLNPGSGSAQDPELVKLQRSLAAAKDGPSVGTEDPTGLSPAAFASIVAWMRSTFEHGDLEQVWTRRLAFGYQVVDTHMARSDFFWFNALPALSGLDLGHRDHPFVATCAGWADSVIDWNDDSEARASREIREKFFG